MTITKKELNAYLNALARQSYQAMRMLTHFQDQILERDTYPILEQEADYEKATESLLDASLAISNLTDPEERDLSFYGTENLDIK